MVVVLEGIANLYFLVALLLPLRSTWLNGSSGRRLAISGACAAAVAMVTSGAFVLSIGPLVSA